ncbi:MAG: hypothetical protein ACTSX7_15140 [Alphaproteobacteria bacterium]
MLSVPLRNSLWIGKAPPVISQLVHVIFYHFAAPPLKAQSGEKPSVGGSQIARRIFSGQIFQMGQMLGRAIGGGVKAI